ncbi:MAG: hypothetical protein AAGE61_18205 [Pseudomonadota bacterium]
MADLSSENITEGNQLSMSDVHPSHIAAALGLCGVPDIVERMQQSDRLKERLWASLKAGHPDVASGPAPHVPSFGPFQICDEFGFACAAIFHRNSVRTIIDKRSVLLLEDLIGDPIHRMALSAPGSLMLHETIFDQIDCLIAEITASKAAALNAWMESQEPALQMGLRLLTPRNEIGAGFVSGEQLLSVVERQGWCEIASFLQAMEENDGPE